MKGCARPVFLTSEHYVRFGPQATCLLEAASTSDFDFLWGAVIAITLFAFLVYNVVATAERLVLSRYREA